MESYSFHCQHFRMYVLIRDILPVVPPLAPPDLEVCFENKAGGTMYLLCLTFRWEMKLDKTGVPIAKEWELRTGIALRGVLL
jgi:hypothetical protein